MLVIVVVVVVVAPQPVVVAGGCCFCSQHFYRLVVMMMVTGLSLVDQQHRVVFDMALCIFAEPTSRRFETHFGIAHRTSAIMMGRMQHLGRPLPPLGKDGVLLLKRAKVIDYNLF
jgi:hypothetical protein